MDWIKELKEYHEFLQWSHERPKLQSIAKRELKQDLEFILGTNGAHELFDFERELCKKLKIRLEY